MFIPQEVEQNKLLEYLKTYYLSIRFRRLTGHLQFFYKSDIYAILRIPTRYLQG